MAKLEEISEPENDGERMVLRVLRDQLPEEWIVVANFVLPQGGRAFECDAAAIGPTGWTYLIETKAWSGPIRGNDADWVLPPLVGKKEPAYRRCPLGLVEQKAKVLASVLRDYSPQFRGMFVQPLVVLANDDPPELEGRCAEHTVNLGEVVTRILEDPRPSGYRKKNLSADLGARAAEVVLGSAKPLRPSMELGSWRLLDQIEAAALWEVWSAVPTLSGSHARPMRLKRYFIDSLLVGKARDAQRARARQDLEALQRLAGASGAVPPVSAIEELEGSMIVVTEWPEGISLESLMSEGEIDGEEADDVVDALTAALSSVHRAGIIHRNLTPACAHMMRDGTVVLTDFDYARIPAESSGVTQHIAQELDRAYSAPELLSDPAKATKASDVWSAARISVALLSGNAEDWRSALAGLTGRYPEVLGRALSDDPGARPIDAEVLHDELFGQSDPQLPLFDGFQPNDELEDRWVVRGAVESGGIAFVYRVHDTMTSQDFAAKFVKDEFCDQIDPVEEYNLLFDVPDHPGLVKPEFPQQLNSFRRQKKQYSAKRSFLLSRWVEGQRLDQLMTEKLPPARCLELVDGIAAAVGHLHAHNLLHRDLKPQNVMVEAHSGQPRVVDFNVSRRHDVADKTETGTPPYRPPDHFDTGWDFGSDIYALGAILAELLAGRLLRHPSPAEYVASDAPLPPVLRPLLKRALAPGASERFATVDEFTAALADARQQLVAVAPPRSNEPFSVASQEELERPNWNPYQRRLISLFSQSRASNAGTRGLDDFASWAYVETLIDRELYPDVAKGDYGLVVITGNAGDGKTAFIQMLERRLIADGGTLLDHQGGNGATIARSGHRFVTNWDGSQDEGDRDNDAVLATFFEPFVGEAPPALESETRVIAINEGRLLDFLSDQRDRFPWLSRRALSFFTGQNAPEEEWFAIVNLNLRALTAQSASDPGGEIVEQLLDRFADERLWEPCEGCVAFEHCYARTNAVVLRDPILGERIRERLRQTLDLVRLRRRLHITMRDLRSTLAFVVAGDRTCDHIVDSFESSDRDALLAGQMYNAIFAASQKLGPPAYSASASQDRLLGVVGTLDVARTADPEDDASLWADGVSMFEQREGDPRKDLEYLSELRERLPQGTEALRDRRAKADLRFLQASFRRKLFLEREDPGWVRMLPYSRLETFRRQLLTCSDADRDAIASAVSQSEGLFHETFRNSLAVRLAGDTDARERSFVLHPVDRFRLEPLDRSSMAHYVEYAPDTIRLMDADHPTINLDIDLDLFETLARILEGFTPSREELRGTWLNLRLFKEGLASLPADSLVLTDGIDGLYRLERKEDTGAIAVEGLV